MTKVFKWKHEIIFILISLAKYSKKNTKKWFEITLCHSQISNFPCKHTWQQIYPSIKCISCSYTQHLLLSCIEKLGHEKPEARGDLLSPGFQPQGRVLSERQSNWKKVNTRCWHGNIKFTWNSTGGSQDAPIGPDLNVMFLEDLLHCSCSSSKIVRLILNSQNNAGFVKSIR